MLNGPVWTSAGATASIDLTLVLKGSRRRDRLHCRGRLSSTRMRRYGQPDPRPVLDSLGEDLARLVEAAAARMCRVRRHLALTRAPFFLKVVKIAFFRSAAGGGERSPSPPASEAAAEPALKMVRRRAVTHLWESRGCHLTSTLTGVMPENPMARAAAGVRSIICLLRLNGPRSLIVTITERPLR
jgi:hypothetical protein